MLSDFIQSVLEWKRITGGSLVVVFLIMAFLWTHGAPQAVTAPLIVNDAKQQATNAVIDAATQASAQTTVATTTAFHETGVGLAQQMRDPVSKATMIIGMDVVGILFSLLIVMTIFTPILAFFGIKI